MKLGGVGGSKSMGSSSIGSGVNVGGGDENDGTSTNGSSTAGSDASETSKISNASSRELTLSGSAKLIGLFVNIAGLGADGGVEIVGGADEKLGGGLGGVEGGGDTDLNGVGGLDGLTTFGCGGGVNFGGEEIGDAFGGDEINGEFG